MENKYRVLKDILSKTFIVSKKSNEQKSELLIKCPYCGDKTDSYHVSTGHFHMYINAETSEFHCFLCNTSGNIFKLLRDFKQNFTTEDYAKLIMLYSSITNENQTKTYHHVEINNKFKKFIDKLYEYAPISNTDNLSFLLKRISIKERDNMKFLNYLLTNKIIFPMSFIKFKESGFDKIDNSAAKLISENNNYIIPIKPLYNGIQIYFPNNNKLPKYMSFKLDADSQFWYNYIGNKINPDSIYIVEGIFDALKLYNILDMNPSVGIVILHGKTNVNNLLVFLKEIGINIYNVKFYFGLDSDLEYDEYLNYIKAFKRNFEIDPMSINILYWMDNHKSKDLGEIKSIEQFTNEISVVQYQAFALKNLYLYLTSYGFKLS